ncbi:hypothetical protein DAI22_10g053100 [Oryza sativa Japonica Group]|nr:hypothetical protein DAI22_10g053100 [Oryza sativa Japonica Group]
MAVAASCTSGEEVEPGFAWDPPVIRLKTNRTIRADHERNADKKKNAKKKRSASNLRPPPSAIPTRPRHSPNPAATSDPRVAAVSAAPRRSEPRAALPPLLRARRFLPPPRARPPVPHSLHLFTISSRSQPPGHLRPRRPPRVRTSPRGVTAAERRPSIRLHPPEIAAGTTSGRPPSTSQVEFALVLMGQMVHGNRTRFYPPVRCLPCQLLRVCSDL